MSMFVGICEIAMLALLTWGGGNDILAFRLPNWLTLSTAIIAGALVIASSAALPAITWHLGFGLAVMAAGLVLFRFNLLGGGDVKWIAALAIWLGPNLNFLRFLVLMGFAGGLLAVIMAVVGRLWPHYGRQEGRLHIPYGVAIALAGMEYWLRSSVIGQSLMMWLGLQK